MEDGFYEQGKLIQQSLIATAESYNLNYDEVCTLFSKAIGITMKSNEPALISYAGKVYYYSVKEKKMRWKTINEKDVKKILNNFHLVIDEKIHNDADIKMNRLINENNNVFYMKVEKEVAGKFTGKLFARNNTKEGNYLISNLEVTLKKADIQKADVRKIKVGNVIMVSILNFSYSNGKIHCYASRGELKFIRNAINLIAIKTKIETMLLGVKINPKTRVVVLKLSKNLKNSKALVSIFVYRIQSIFNFKIVYNF